MGSRSTNNIDSDATFQLVVENPCMTTSYTIPELVKGAGGNNIIEARELGGEVILQYQEPEDTASVTYGPNVGITDRLTLCGPRRHYMVVDGEELIFGSQTTTQAMTAFPFLEF